MHKSIRLCSLLLAMSLLGAAFAQATTLTIESWRNDDLAIWRDIIIPAFNEQHPDIQVVFSPSAPPEYNAVLNSKLEAGSAGDLITCRPFDPSLELYNQGHLESLNDLAGMENFSDVAKSAWITDDGSDVFCVPMASVIHGFIYNQDIFNELGLEEPQTYEEFIEMLGTIQEAGYAPLVMGTADQWEAATMGYQNIGPNYWQGEEGRRGLIEGTIGYNEGGFLEAFEALAEWQPYLPEGYQAMSYPDAQNFFAFGMGAIYPAGSWDISVFNPLVDFEMGAFAPPPPAGQDTCYISDHTDIAMGINAASPNKEAARTFLEWMTTQEFAELYANALPGFFPLANHDVTLDDPLAQEFLSWRDECESTIRSSYQILSRGTPNNENDLWNASAQVLNGTQTPQEAADAVQRGLESWYEPQQNR
jgi:raffinose/stachyose/melibiose transport system substrate-binding protein